MATARVLAYCIIKPEIDNYSRWPRLRVFLVFQSRFRQVSGYYFKLRHDLFLTHAWSRLSTFIQLFKTLYWWITESLNQSTLLLLQVRVKEWSASHEVGLAISSYSRCKYYQSLESEQMGTCVVVSECWNTLCIAMVGNVNVFVRWQRIDLRQQQHSWPSWSQL
jgi:hypothetical protein